MGPAVRSLMTGIGDGCQKKSGLARFLRELRSLDSLSIIFWNGWTSDVSTYWAGKDWAKLFTDDEDKVSVKEVMLSGYMPQTFKIAMGHMFKLSTITKLVFMDCTLSSLQDLFRRTELQNLLYLKLNTDDSILPTEDNFLRDFLRQNHFLEELYFKFGNLAHIFSLPQVPTSHPLSLNPMTAKLKTISLTDLYFEDTSNFGLSFYALLETVCHKFRGLRQLGIQSRVLDSFRHITSAPMKDQFLLDHLVSIRSIP